MSINNLSFKNHAIVACGTLSPELNYLRETGFLNADKILYTKPGLHKVACELEKQLDRQLKKAREYSSKIIVVYGEGCYINSEDPFFDIDKLMEVFK